MGTLNSREWKSWHHNAVEEITGVEFSAPNIRAGKCGSGNLGRRKSMESEAIIIADCIDCRPRSSLATIFFTAIGDITKF